MTTRAGLLGLAAGLLLSAVLHYPLYGYLPGLSLADWPPASPALALLLTLAGVLLLLVTGSLAAHWSRPANLWQCLSLGALAGGLASFIAFSSLGAAAAGSLSIGYVIRSAEGNNIPPSLFAETILRLTTQTPLAFWGMLLSGILLGALGSLPGLPPRGSARPLVLENHPMLALNASITVFLSSAFALALVFGLFSPLLQLLQARLHGTASLLTSPSPAIPSAPLLTALILYLASHLALALVVPHEARRATHRCAIDEVKMAACIGIFAPILLALALALLNLPLLLFPAVLLCLLLSALLLARLVAVLFTLILPRRLQLPPRPTAWKRPSLAPSPPHLGRGCSCSAWAAASSSPPPSTSAPPR